MNEDALRALIRESIAKHLGAKGAGESEPLRVLALADHVSHDRYALPESEGQCLIEPSVRCVHCGYCQSHGH
jgi:hypothetical protein